MAEWLPEHIAAIIITAIISVFSSGFAMKLKYSKISLSNNQFADNSGVNVSGSPNSTFNLQTTPLAPLRLGSKPQPQSELKETVRDILKRIGRERISTLLQEAKIVALESKDKEMEKWIEQELSGYVPHGNSSPSIKNKEIAGGVPDYRRVRGKFDVQFNDTGEIEELEFPFRMAHSISSIENSIDRLQKGGVIVTQTVMFPNDLELFGGKEGKVELPLQELQAVVRGVERRLSQSLEAKLIE